MRRDLLQASPRSACKPRDSPERNGKGLSEKKVEGRHLGGNLQEKILHLRISVRRRVVGV
jgi:hypothetical protein